MPSDLADVVADAVAESPPATCRFWVDVPALPRGWLDPEATRCGSGSTGPRFLAGGSTQKESSSSPFAIRGRYFCRWVSDP
jgi:hypothetical protein